MSDRLKFMLRFPLLLASLIFASCSSAFAGSVQITNFGHSAILIKGGGRSVLLNPFKAVGCASGLKEPRLKVNLILASSELADEGARVAKGVFLVQPGSYRVGGLSPEGFSTVHDRVGGRRFGNATLWRWRQNGLEFAHLGGSAGSILPADKVLLGRPDVLIIAVGGGAKAYTGKEAAKITKELNPKRVIPVQYINGKRPKDCDLNSVQPFLNAMEGTQVIKSGRQLTLSSNMKEKTIIHLMR